MKRNVFIATVVALLLVVGITVTASAQNGQTTPPGTPGACANGNWVDANNDGVCDNAPRDGTGQQFGRRNGQGQGTGQGMGQGLGHGPNFVDEDQDGTCDNFVDADGDGQCDNCGGIQRGPRSGSGQGMGRGMHGGRVWNGQNQP